MADDQEDEASRLLKKILSPAEEQSLVLPPPDHAPASGPGESTPLTGNLAKPPTQATPARQGLAGYFAGASPAEAKAQDRSGDPDFLPRSTGLGRGCALPSRRAHEVRQRHQAPQEIRGASKKAQPIRPG